MLAEDLIDVHSKPREVPPFSQAYPGLTPGQGYAAARALHGHRQRQGWRPVGRKIGFTNTTLWERYGVHEPIWGTVYDRTLVTAIAGVAEVPLAGLVQPRIEPEICVGLKSIPPRSRDPRALLESIEWIAHSIEVVQCHHPAWKVTLPDCTASNGLHGRLVLGTRIPVTGDLADKLPLVQVILRKNGKEVERGTGSNVLGSPLLALAHFVELIERDFADLPLRPGELISTGTLTDAYPVAPGETWSTELSGVPLPGLEVRFR
jgi:2-oxo-3-hexenedioate decarboxylase